VIRPWDFAEAARYALVALACVVALIVIVLVRIFVFPPRPPVASVAIVTSLGVSADTYGQPFLDGANLAAAEANADGRLHVALTMYDDRSSDDDARAIARKVVASDALVAVGPVLTASSIASGAIYADAGLVSIVPTAHGDGVTAAATTFRAVFSTSEMGDSLANYFRHVLGGTRVFVIYRDNGFGRPIADGIKAAAQRLKIAVTARAFNSDAEREEAAKAAAADPDKPAIVLGMLDADAAAVLTTLRRQGVRSPILGPSALANESFARRFADQPEERKAPGYFTNGLYAASPIMLDSANAETVAFADRFRARYHREPTWVDAQAFDATNLAITAARAVTQSAGKTDLRTQRDRIRAYLAALDGPAHALASLAGPLWFTADRGRSMPVRVGRFQDGLFVSAPLQLLPVSNPDPAEIAAHTLLDIGGGRYARRQLVAYTGIFLNEIPRIDIAQSRFTADFYLWIRFARGATVNGADPSDIDFPDLVRGGFDAKRTAAERELDDGTSYRLWRMRGDFKNDVDLHIYPADRQTLAVHLFNARAASDKLVYALDRRPLSPDAGGTMSSPPISGRAAAPEIAGSSATFGSIAAPTAFRNLSRWQVLGVSEQRDSLVTGSALGDLGLVGLERVRELSGFKLTVDLRRQIGATLAKILLPLALMSLIMFASLYFPITLVKEKVTVAIIGTLAGAVLLVSTNLQLGNLGYVSAVETVFYVFFVLCLLCILVVIAAERLRADDLEPTAIRVEQSGRYLFLFGLAVAAVITAGIAYRLW
jgi:branched-chain amino acid transport system substrate-binding protein